MAAWIDALATAAGVKLAGDVKSGAVDIMVGLNQYNLGVSLSDAQSTTPLVQAQVLAEGTIATLLGQIAGGTGSIATAVAGYTGAALATAIGGASVGTVVPAALSINDVTKQRLSNGDTLYSFTVSMVAVPTTTSAVSVHYATRDETASASGGDYDASSGTLTWAAGDTSSRTITVTVHGSSTIQPSKMFDVVLTEPVGTAIAKGTGAGTIVAPTYATSTTLVTSNASSVYGEGVSFTATVTTASGNPKPQGTVVFMAGSAYLGEATVGTDGKATISNIKLPVGTYAMKAQFKMNESFDASVSASLSQTVSKTDPVPEPEPATPPAAAPAAEVPAEPEPAASVPPEGTPAAEPEAAAPAPEGGAPSA
jgi:hypothetical protein